MPEQITDHSKCKFSTGIHDGITAGQGKLDFYGFWEFPCPECATKAQKEYDEAMLLEDKTLALTEHPDDL
jgi:hypothetical protein